ncbi:MAG: 1-acyl-sn-glycerol-3-phosphate acyltransferase, partial [Planctomycetota bacterium]
MSRVWWHGIRFLARLCIAAYYRSFRVENAERIPEDGPVLFVVNHPNALLDGAAVLRAVPRPLGMAAKSTLFQMPVLGWMLRKIGALPVYRPQDKHGKGRENLKMFSAFTELFRAGGAALIFPEGVSHLDPELKEVKSGAARLALDSEADAQFELGLRVVPIGLHFEPKSQFRGEVHVRIGAPFTVTDLKETHRRTAIRTVQKRITDGLRPLMLHLEAVELEPLVRGIAEVYDEWQRSQPDSRAPRPRAEVVQIAGACLNHFLVTDPEAVETARKKLHWYQRLARRMGVSAAAMASHEHPFRTWLAFVGLAVRVLLGFPLFLIGVLTGYLPYSATAAAARRSVKGEGDVALPILRVGWGLIFFGVFWGVLCTVVLMWSRSLPFTLFFFALLVTCGLYANYYTGRLALWRSRMEGLRPLVRPGIDRVAAAREDLLTFVSELVRRYSDATGAALLPPRKRKWYLVVPWRRMAACVLVGLLAWFAWGLRDRGVFELAGAPSPWQTLDAVQAREALDSDAKALVSVLDTLDALEARMRILRVEFDAEEREYTDEGDATVIRQALLTYLNCRATLFRMAWFYRRSERQGEPAVSRRAALLGYAAAIELARRGMQFVEVFAGKKKAIRKLNEGDAAWGLPPDSYDRVRRNLADREIHEELAAATARFERSDFTGFADGPSAWPRILSAAHAGGPVVARLADSLWNYKWDAAVARAKRTVGAGRYELSKFFAVVIGKVRVRSGELAHGLISQAQVEWLREEHLRPGDILLERRNWALSNVFLPGFWTHAALYIGGVDGLGELGLLDHDAVQPHLEALRTTDGRGNPRVVLEALGPGVVLNPLEYSVGAADAVCVLRPRMGQAAIADAVARAMRQFGKPYDFDFDFFSADRLVCTELVYKAYQGPIEFELQEIMGRKTLPAVAILKKWSDERGAEDAQLEYVCFLDSHEDEGVARPGNETRLLE